MNVLIQLLYSTLLTLQCHPDDIISFKSLVNLFALNKIGNSVGELPFYRL